MFLYENIPSQRCRCATKRGTSVSPRGASQVRSHGLQSAPSAAENDQSGQFCTSSGDTVHMKRNGGDCPENVDPTKPITGKNRPSA